MLGFAGQSFAYVVYRESITARDRNVEAKADACGLHRFPSVFCSLRGTDFGEECRLRSGLTWRGQFRPRSIGARLEFQELLDA